MDSYILRRAVTAAAMAVLLCPVLRAITVPGANNSDGELTITANTVIDLNQATSGAWDSASPVAGKGVYDAAKWAVVFHYSKVTIGNNATLSFTNRAQGNPPVVWLVSGDVSINGTVSLQNNYRTSGPGGFDAAYDTGGCGFGPGSGNNTGGSYATTPTYSPSTVGKPYGNPLVMPLIGGSGGIWEKGSGGAILIACGGSIYVAGNLTANGSGDGGSGGGIRCVASKISGPGTVYARASNATYAGLGRIRLEANDWGPGPTVYPDPSQSAPTEPVTLWPAPDSPALRIVSVNAVAAPVTPNAYRPPMPADMNLDAAGQYDVVIESTNMPITRKVRVKMTPRAAAATLTEAVFVSGNDTLATWKARVQFLQGFSTLLARSDVD